MERYERMLTECLCQCDVLDEMCQPFAELALAEHERQQQAYDVERCHWLYLPLQGRKLQKRSERLAFHTQN